MQRGQDRRVLFDGTAFMLHRWSGITRYFTELMGEYYADPGLGVDPVAPYRYVTNAHLTASGHGFRSVPLPHRYRTRVLGALNRRIAARTDLAGAVVHFPLYDGHLLDAARTHRSVTTVYDFTIEANPDLFGVDLSKHLSEKRAMFEACDALVCISEATHRDLRRFHPDLDKPVVVAPLAVSADFARHATAPVRGLPERYVLHVGNRHKHKNIELVLEAFAAVARQDATLHLVLSGQGLDGEPEQLAHLGIAERTHRVRLSDRDLPSAYRHAQAFLYPSRYEGFGLPLVEAMAAGCPTLISDTPALVEVAGDAAEVVGVDDVDGAAASLSRLLADPLLAARYRERGRRRAADFTWRRTAELTATAYSAARSA